MIYQIISKLNATFDFSRKFSWPLLLFSFPIMALFILLVSIIPTLFSNNEFSSLLIIVTSMFYKGAFYTIVIYITDCLYNNKLVSITDIKLFFRVNFLPVSIATIVISMFALIGIFLFIIPGIYIYYRLAITPYVLSLEGKSFQGSFIKSFESSKHYTLIIFLCGFIISLPQAILFLDQFVNSFFPAWIVIVVGYLTSILETVLFYHFYMDIKTKIIKPGNQELY